MGRGETLLCTFYAHGHQHPQAQATTKANDGGYSDQTLAGTLLVGGPVTMPRVLGSTVT